MKLSKFAPLGAASVAALIASRATLAAEQPQPFDLGEIHVGLEHKALPLDKKKDDGPAPLQQTDSYGGVTISNRQNETFQRDSLDRAVNLAAGVVSNSTGGTRNEQNIYVRGFDRWQVPLTIDGVRVYLPADNRLDFARFMTPDVAAVQIAKGYVSVLDGPGGMGGQINLVSRKPAKEIEGELRTGLEFGRDGSYEGIKTYALLGTKQDNYYLQLSGSWRDLRGWMLPESYTPTNNQGEGFRGNSGTYDWSLNAKAGYTPNDTDEYSLSFIRQDGKKGAPYHTTDGLNSQRYWRWPYWRVQNLYFLSNTKIGDSSYVKTKAYWSKFDNDLFSYNDPFLAYQSSAKAFRSYYQDYALGADVEVGHDFGELDTLKIAGHYRFDEHATWQEYYGVNVANKSTGCVINVICFTQPIVYTQEDTYSIAVENTFHPTKDIDLVGGFAYDWRHLRKADDFVVGTGVIGYQLRDVQAPNFQGAAIWRYSDTNKVYFNVSDRERFPTIFERFSSRFGGATSNPGLMPERAINFDIGWASEFAPGSRIQLDAFHSIVRNLIQSVPAPAYGASVTQSQNVGDASFWGGEVTVDYRASDELSLGGNLTLMRRSVYAPYILNFQPTGVPDGKMFLYAGWRPFDGLTLTPNVEMNSNRWTSNTAGTIYYRTGAFFLANFTAEYQLHPNFKIEGGVRNMFDTAYTFTDGYPEAGRSFFLGAKATF
ncbi:TonB-dependent receptor [Methylosinus sporium]|uniref:TonB-dependent receptor n=1 Tax=Methylosinus sporium TaxID=428 RepID=A0A549T007_METSR|nr:MULTISPECIES: TonB-dependent receptor [Methylosinus]MBU3888136.1 TonB-dependent receptor [Methylosinus sp. KRF6]TRL35209.1 TonB-dependent receptor [Methylosinus sporium]